MPPSIIQISINGETVSITDEKVWQRLDSLAKQAWRHPTQQAAVIFLTALERYKDPQPRNPEPQGKKTSESRLSSTVTNGSGDGSVG